MTDLLLTVSRLQFAVTAIFHMIFPSITVGLSLFLVGMYAAYVRTGRAIYLTIYRFWLRLFAVAFAIGVVSGIVLTFEFGLNWAAFAAATGPILGVLIGLEVVTAFFLEAGFLGIMLYGEGRVGKRLHLFATCMVALGTLLSTIWIMTANSWMQTPAGYTQVAGQFQPTDWMAAVFSPSFVYRFLHMLLGVLVAAGFLIAGTSAYHLLKSKHLEVARRTFSLSLGIIGVVLPLQFYMGDSLAVAMFGFQPSKVEALEGNFNSTNTGWNVFVIPDQANQRNLVQISIPCLGSVFYQDLTCQAPTPGLSQTPIDEQPPLSLPFWGFRIMFYLATVMFVVMAASIVLRLRGRLYSARWFHRLVLWTTPGGILAIVGGWILAESGRQPWIVWGQLRTVDAVSPFSAPVVVATAAIFICLYVTLLAIWIAYYIRTVRRGPVETSIVAPGGDKPYELSEAA
jgi:cytochrome d ubiquinol oxidase subunit I